MYKRQIWKSKADDKDYMQQLVENGEDITIVGIVQPDYTASASMLTSGIAYPCLLYTSSRTWPLRWMSMPPRRPTPASRPSAPARKSTRPVSYTHLDVYKRQGILCAEAAHPTGVAGGRTAKNCYLPVALRDEVDVYKRQ